MHVLRRVPAWAPPTLMSRGGTPGGSLGEPGIITPGKEPFCTIRIYLQEAGEGAKCALKVLPSCSDSKIVLHTHTCGLWT